MKLKIIPFCLHLLLVIFGTCTYSIADEKTDALKIAEYKRAIEKTRNAANDSSAYYAERGLLYSIGNHYMRGQAEMLMTLAIIDREQGRYEQAKSRGLFVMGLYRQLHDLKCVALLQNFIGSLEAARKNNQAAVEYFSMALELHDTIVTDNAGRMLTYMNLGKLYLLNNDTAAAGQYLLGAEALAKKIPVSDTTIVVNNYIAELYMAEHNQQKALQYLLTSIALSDKPEFMSSRAQSLYSLGLFYSKQGDINKATDSWNSALEIARRQNMYAMQMNILLNKAGIALPHMANEYLDQAMEICNRMHNPATRARLYGELAMTYERQGKYMDAIYAVKQQNKIIDSIDQMNREREFKENKALYRLVRSDSRIRHLEELSQRNATLSTVVTVISICLIVALTTMIIMYSQTKKLNDKLVTHEQQLSDLNTTKNKLFSIIGHDLRAPLTRIYTVLDLYDKNIFEEHEKKGILDDLKEHTRITTETLDKLLYWGQSLMKGTTLQQMEFQVKAFIDQNIELKHSAAADKKITLVDNSPDDLTVFADHRHFDFIIRNLLANAIKFSFENGRIEINSQPKDDFVVFSVEDNGVGIPQERLSRIFEPFHSTEGTAKEKGTGMGLMLCKEFAIRNGGDLWVESTPDKGTAFFFSLKRGDFDNSRQ